MREPMSRPNFLLFITDQQRYDHAGYAGNPVLRTPNLDAMAQSGAWFSRFFVASPTCMSSRATLMTGRMPSLHGVRFNGLPLDLDSVTFVDLLRAAGYRTALVGKSHLQGMTEAPSLAPTPVWGEGLQSPPPELSEARRRRHDRSRYSAEMAQCWARDPRHGANIALPYYGFGHVEFCLGHGDLVGGHYLQWLRKKAGGEVGRGIDHARALGAAKAPQAYQPEMPEDCYPTRFVAERSIACLERWAAADRERPFFLQCSFPDPHHPFTPPGRYWSMYSPEAVQLPPSFHDPNRSAIPPVQLLWEEYEAGAPLKRWTFPFVCGEAQAREIVAKTYGQITMIDDALGSVLEALERLGLAENTVLCFLSDHGDYLGDHGLMLKGPMHYQSVIRVPCVWRDPDPRYRCGRADAPASMLDIPRTVLARAGLQPFNGIQGANLLPILAGEQQGRGLPVLVETTTQYPYLGFDGLVSVATLIDERWRLSVWQGRPWGELYDLHDDPWEMKNLWDDPAHRDLKSSLLLKLVHAIQDHGETSPYPLSVS